jgi:hypothetical protein
MNTAGNDTNTKIQFVQYHSPGIATGDYVITLTQEVTIRGVAPQAPFSTQRHFSIYGERFALKPTDIVAIFPPDGNLGEHSNVLPHLILDRSTLPWERQADASRNDVPWLALLLFDASEKPTPQIVKLSDLTTPTVKFPALHLETGQVATDAVTVIDVKQHVLQMLLPTADELALLAHVRVSGNSTSAAQEQAVLIGNRLPARNVTSTVHLVSLEGRYVNGSFDFQGAGGENLVRLVSLKSWSFSCVDEKQSFKGLLLNLDRQPAMLRLPPHSASTVENYLSQGAALLPHTLRQASRTFSWYHGPLVTAEHKDAPPLPVRAADALVRYNATTGLFDISYAAAWQLGVLLALQSKQFSTNLYLWKRTHAQQLRQVEQQLRYAFLPLQGQSVDANEQFKAISTWFASLSLLRGVPFNYLVPDEAMLPKEAIRFFWVDSTWIDCLLDGAFSIGRVTNSDHAQDTSQVVGNSSPAANPHEQITGCLLRSNVVAGWPGLQVSGYDNNGSSLPLLRLDRLSPNVLICLFEGEIQSIAISLKPETLHFGLDSDGHIPPTYSKILRDSQGNEQEALTIPNIPWKQADGRILDITNLAQAIQQKTTITPLNSAPFALQMIEGAEEVIFQREI